MKNDLPLKDPALQLSWDTLIFDLVLHGWGALVDALIHFASVSLPKPRVIFDRDGVSAYLSRWYLFGTGPRAADGQDPFTDKGHPREKLDKEMGK